MVFLLLNVNKIVGSGHFYDWVCFPWVSRIEIYF